MPRLQLFKVRQHFESQALADPIGDLRMRLTTLDQVVRPGHQIAIAVGSRGILHLQAFVQEVAAHVTRLGARPFVVPAMGSHGGATAEGQREILELYGISEAEIGVPLRASMDVVELPNNGLPHAIFMDRHAYQSDGVILINRIKPHTDYHGRYESGLMKMAAIGLGKLQGATAIHHFGIEGLRDMLGAAASQVLACGKIVGGIAIVEDAYHQTAVVRVLRATDIPEAEPLLLEKARASMPSLPAEHIDALIVDRMGKNISGVGLDPNVTGRMGVRGQADPGTPDVRSLVVSDLTDESHGNAIGVGLADVITRRLYDKINWSETYRNVVTSSFLERGKLPIVAESDREALEIALRSCGHISDHNERIIRIGDTLNLEEVRVSRAIADQLRAVPSCEVAAEPSDLFDQTGALTAL